MTEYTPGWYGEGSQPNVERYHDGNRWTDAERPAKVKTGMPGLAVAGYWFAVLVPIVGLILGVIVGARHQPGEGKNHGPWIIATSVVVFLAVMVIMGIALAAETASTTTEPNPTDYLY